MVTFQFIGRVGSAMKWLPAATSPIQELAPSNVVTVASTSSISEKVNVTSYLEMLSKEQQDLRGLILLEAALSPGPGVQRWAKLRELIFPYVGLERSNHIM